MNICKNNQNAAILKIIKISENFHGRFTANYPKFLSSASKDNSGVGIIVDYSRDYTVVNGV